MLQPAKRGEEARLQHGMVVTKARGGLRRLVGWVSGLGIWNFFVGLQKGPSQCELFLHDTTHNGQIKVAR